MIRKHVLGVCMCIVCVCVCVMYQTKVSKLVVQLDNENRLETGSDSERNRRHQLVRVCSWTDRRNGDGKPQNSSAEESSDDVQVMPSVRELAKHFSSKCVSAVEYIFFFFC